MCLKTLVVIIESEVHFRNVNSIQNVEAIALKVIYAFRFYI